MNHNNANDDTCKYHLEHKALIGRNKEDIETMRIEVNTMKKWVIGGMGTVILQVLFFIGSKIW